MKTKIRPTKRVKLIDEIPADELHIRVFMNRRTIHSFFTDPRTLKQFPLVVKIPDPKEGTPRLVNLAAREEFYDRLKVFPMKVAVKGPEYGSVSPLSN